MKKIVYTTAVICILAALVSCKSTKAGKKAGSVAEAPSAAEGVEESPAVITGKKEKKSKKDKQAKKEKKAKNKEDENSAAIGWIKSPRKRMNERYGKVQIKVKPGIGSYTIAAINEREKGVPVLSTSNEYIANTFYLKTSKKIYNLLTDGSVKSSARKTADGLVIEYDVPSVAQVSAYFTFLSSEKSKENDMVKVTLSVKNTGARNDDFSLKAILDTVLGESGSYHFYNHEDIPVKNEVLYRTLQNQKWFVSKNLNASMQLFFTGADCTVPDLVALANYSTLEKNTWEPDMLNYRVFDTVLSYNNSAVCAIWKPMKLATGDTGRVVFYLALAANGMPATGEKYIYGKNFKEPPAEEKASGKKKSASALEIITPYSPVPDDELISEPEVTEVAEVTENPAEEEASEIRNAEDIPPVDFYIQNMKKEQLSPEYIQDLLDRIAALEEDSPSYNRQELLRLNAELDAILTYLRQ